MTSKKMFMSTLITFFFCCVTGKAMVPAPPKVDPFSKMTTKEEYVPNQIIVKYKKDTAGLVEKEMAKGKRGKNLVVSASLDRLNTKLKLKNVRPVFKNFKQNNEKIQNLKNRPKAQLTKLEKRILKRQKRAPKNIDIPALDRIYLIEVEPDPAVSLEDLVKQYNNDPQVEYAELNYLVTAYTEPNDPYYSLQWALTAIDAEGGWDLAVHENDVVVAVIDTGVDYNHLDLQGSMWTNEAEAQGSAGVDDDGNGYVDDIYGYDFCELQPGGRDGKPMDDNGHGTHCAGIIAAQTNNSMDVAGTSLNAKIMALKFITYYNSGADADAVASIYYAIDHGADILSNSWGGPYPSDTLQEAINYVYARGALFVAAAGNDSKGYVYGHPSSDENVLNVASLDSDGEKASTSNYGDWVDVAAPGVEILSLRAAGTDQTYWYDPGQTFYPPYDPNATSCYMSGTSMACPYVSGICAVLWESDPTLSVDEITDVLLQTGDPIADGICLSDRCVNLADALDYVYTDPEGRVATDREIYSCSDSIKITVCDGDLESEETQSVTVTTTGGDSEVVVLEKADVATYFMGYLTTDPNVVSTGDGKLQVEHDDEITVTYEDEDPSATLEATAVVDCEGPVITDIDVEEPGPRPAVYFTTDEPTTATIYYALDCEEPYDSVTNSVLETEHRVVIDGVSPDTTYYYYIEAEDSVGNVTQAPNPGECYSFTTTAVGTIYVPADAPTIQKGVDYCWDGNTVVVSAGTYTEGVYIHGREITVQSTDPDDWDVVKATIIDGDDINEVYDTVTLNGSEATVKGFSIVNSCFEGVSSYEGNSVISNCIIEGEEGKGKGVVCNGSGSLTVKHCEIQNNSVGIAAAYLESTTLDLIIRNTILHDNTFSFKRDSSGGSTDIVNSTMVGEIETSSTTNMTITNSILWGNDFPDVWGDNYNITYSCTPESTPGVGNITGNPCFVDPSNGNYHLSADSPCMNMGDNSAVNSGEKDTDNQNRIIGGTVDIGADEYSSIQNPNNGLAYNTIQDAIDDADTGDEIVVYPGTYHGNIDFGGNEITLRSSDPDDWDVVADTIIDGEGVLFSCVTFENGEDPNTVLKGFTLRNGNAAHGIYCEDSSPTIANCIIANNGYGVGIRRASPVISNCIVRDNSLIGIVATDNSSPVVSNCIVDNNALYGIHCNSTSPLEMRNSVVVNNGGYGVYCYSGSVTNSILWGNDDGDLYGCSATYSCFLGGTGTNISSDPNFVDNDPFYHLTPHSPCISGGTNSVVGGGEVDIDGQSRILHGIVDMGADEAQDVVVLNITQDIAYTTIQAAIDDADTDDEIVVYPGTYYQNIDFDNKSITLRSSAPTNWDVVAATIIDTTDEGVNSVTFESGEDPNSVLKGFTIRAKSVYSGIHCDNSSPTIGNCIIEGGMYGVYCYSALPKISNCIVRNCNLSGISCFSASSPVISNCIVDNSTYWGIGIYSSSAEIRNSTIVNNYSGVYATGASATVTNCILWGNGSGDLSGCSATYSCFLGGTGTNISSDPNFVDNDPFYHLTPHSPCISGGTNSVVGGGEVDIDGQPRILHGIVDMGADEAQDVAVLNITQDIAYTTIQAAIDDADTNDVIVVYPGTYHENIDFGGNEITLRSSDPDDPNVVADTIIDGEGVLFSCVTFENGEDLNTVLKGFTLRNGNTAYGIYCEDSSPTIANCIIEDAMTGIYCNAASPKISNCIIENNDEHGVHSKGNAAPTIQNNIIRDNPTGIICKKGAAVIRNNLIYGNGDGIILSEEVNTAQIINNTIVYNDDGIAKGNPPNKVPAPTITNCILWGNTGEDLDDIFINDTTYSCIEDGDGVGQNGNIDDDPCFVASDPFYHLASNSPCIDAGDPNGIYTGQTDIDGQERVVDGIADIGVDEIKGIAYNKTQDNWYSTISRAVASSDDYDVIEVAEGTYYENIDFGGKAITLTSTDPDDWDVVAATNIESADEWDYTVIFESGEDPNSVLKGFTISNSGFYSGIGCISSSPTIANCIVEEGNMSGITCSSASSPVISNCIVRENVMSGITCYSASSPVVSNCIIDNNGYLGIDCTSSSPVISNCSVRDNSMSGIACGSASSPVISNCIVDNNGYCGIACRSASSPVISNCSADNNFDYGIYCHSSSPVISNCSIDNNGYRGIYCVSSSPVISNCSVSDNEMSGIYCYSTSSLSISNCIVDNNGDLAMGYDSEPGIYCDSTSSVAISNSTMVDNVTYGIECESGSSATITNCIIWENEGGAIEGPATVTYSDVEGGDEVDGNIDSDPLFVTGTLGDYYLSEDAIEGQEDDSPCIDAGSDTAANLDLDELTTRTDDVADSGIVDMGYHYQP